MKYRKYSKAVVLTTLLLSSAILSSCHDDPAPASNKRSYTIDISNLTADQPFSPIALIAHKAGYHAWVEGDAASMALEQLAEGGDNSTLLNDAKADVAYLASESDTQALPPGGMTNFQLSLEDGRDAKITLISMLVNTNDGYTGTDALDLSQLANGETLRISMPVWDAGTESNSEAVGTIPGPADGGEGFNAARDDIADFVAIHRGVLSSDDGLATSVLSETHRFDNPAGIISITRTE